MSDNLVEYDIRLRNTGKTTDLIEWWKGAPNRIIVVPDQQHVALIRKEALTPREVTRRIITFDDLRAGRVLRGRADCEVGIDNVDELLARMMPPNVLLRRVTATGLLTDPTLLSIRHSAAYDA